MRTCPVCSCTCNQAIDVADFDLLQLTNRNTNGQYHNLEIPDTVYIPDLQYRLLAPQYLKRCERLQGIINEDGKQSTGMVVDEHFSTLYFNGGRNSVRINHISSTRVPALPINRGQTNFSVFCSQIRKIHEPPATSAYIFPTVSPDEDFSTHKENDIVMSQHEKVVDVVEQIPDQEDAMEKLIGIDYSHFTPEQLEAIFNQNNCRQINSNC